MGIVIQGFSPTDKVPQVFGETKTGQGPVTAGSVPLLLLVVGLIGSTGGTATPNTQLVKLTAGTDADLAFGARCQITRMGYAAIAANPDATVWALGVPPASGAVAATAAITLSGTWSSVGNFGYRLAGQPRIVTVQANDTPETVATTIANDINSVAEFPATAAATQVGSTSTWQVVLTHASPGASGNLQVLAIDTSQVPSGFVASITGPTWATLTAELVGQYVVPTTANGYFYKCTVAGTTGASQPSWPSTVGTTVADGTVTWTCVGAILTGGLVPFNSGAGVENVSAALATIATTQFDRIASGANDSTNLGLWRTQIDAGAGPISNLLQQVVVATNSASAATQTLATTTLNDTRFEVFRVLNCETHPSELAASHAATRVGAEASCPASFYNYAPVVGAAPQSQKADWPNHATLVSDLNAGVSPGTTYPDGTVRIVRAITSHSLNGSTPDYSTLDVAQMTVPDAFRAFTSQDWVVYAAQNPAVEPDPAPGQRYPQSGVATPSLWNVRVTDNLNAWQAGTGFLYPQIQQVATHLPQSFWNPQNNCIMSAIPTLAVYNNAQLGVSVRGQTQ
jgi:phage tail sheath gpL-like